MLKKVRPCDGCEQRGESTANIGDNTGSAATITVSKSRYGEEPRSNSFKLAAGTCTSGDAIEVLGQ